MNSKANARSHKKRWYEKYLPFVAKSPEVQIKWLASAFKKGNLTSEEIAPYVRLVLTDMENDEKKQQQLVELFNRLDNQLLEKLFQAADIYDISKLFSLIRQPTIQQAMIALRKSPPPYEKTPQLVFDRVFQAIHDKSASLLEQAAAALKNSREVPEHFEAAYERFQEIVEDEKLLSALYPKAGN